MANSDVISAVSETLESRLSALGAPPPTARLHDLVTPVTTEPPTVTLFPYHIVEDPSVRNGPKTTRVVNGELRALKQPLGLCLHYMVTAWSGDRHTERPEADVCAVVQETCGGAAAQGYDAIRLAAAGTDPVALRPLVMPAFGPPGEQRRAGLADDLPDRRLAAGTAGAANAATRDSEGGQADVESAAEQRVGRIDEVLAALLQPASSPPLPSGSRRVAMTLPDGATAPHVFPRSHHG